MLRSNYYIVYEIDTHWLASVYWLIDGNVT